MNSEPQNYCPYPFTQLTTTPTGRWKLCCSSSEAFGAISDFSGEAQPSIRENSPQKFWNGEYLKWVREKHLKREPIKECAACFLYEKNGAESYRQRALKEFGMVSQPLKTPISLDLKLGNKCNAACLFCDPSSSSRVLKEWQEIGWDQQVPFDSGLTGVVNQDLFSVDYDWAESPDFWSELLKASQNLKNLKFTGGEPLINSYMVKYLDHLVENDYAKNIRLQTTTNGIVVPEKFLKILPRFREVQLNFSVDGFGKQNEYIRHPTKWEPWLKNIHRVMDSVPENVELYFQHSISAYSVFGLSDYFRWMWPYKRFRFHLFKVFHPRFQRTELLTTPEKKQVAEQLTQLLAELSTQVTCERDAQLLREIEGIRGFIVSEEDWSFMKPQLRSFLQTLDKHRKVSLRDAMPHAADSIGL